MDNITYAKHVNRLQHSKQRKMTAEVKTYFLQKLYFISKNTKYRERRNLFLDATNMDCSEDEMVTIMLVKEKSRQNIKIQYKEY